MLRFECDCACTIGGLVRHVLGIRLATQCWYSMQRVTHAHDLACCLYYDEASLLCALSNCSALLAYLVGTVLNETAQK